MLLRAAQKRVCCVFVCEREQQAAIRSKLGGPSPGKNVGDALSKPRARIYLLRPLARASQPAAKRQSAPARASLGAVGRAGRATTNELP